MILLEIIKFLVLLVVAMVLLINFVALIHGLIAAIKKTGEANEQANQKEKG